jgi:hypothetical protein
MKNPWLAKNPFLSMWLSAANTMFGAARGHAMNEVRRQQAAASRTMVESWTRAAAPPKRSRKRRAKSR